MESIAALELQERLGKAGQLLFQVRSNLLRVQLANGATRELTEPVLGRDVVAGILEDGITKGFFRYSQVRSIEFMQDLDLVSDCLATTRRTMGELLAKELFPRTLAFAYQADGGNPQRATVTGVYRGLIFTDFANSPAIPIAALALVELNCA